MTREGKRNERKEEHVVSKPTEKIYEGKKGSRPVVDAHPLQSAWQRQLCL